MSRNEEQKIPEKEVWQVYDLEKERRVIKGRSIHQSLGKDDSTYIDENHGANPEVYLKKLQTCIKKARAILEKKVAQDKYAKKPMYSLIPAIGNSSVSFYMQATFDTKESDQDVLFRCRRQLFYQREAAGSEKELYKKLHAKYGKGNK